MTKSNLKRILYVSVTVLYFACTINAQVSAISKKDLQDILNGYAYYDSNSTLCSSGTNDSSTDGNGAVTKSISEFVDAYGQMAYDNSIKSGVPYEVTLAQAIVESGYGQSGLTKTANNFFGIKKGSDWTGEVVYFKTREVIGGKSIYVDAPFRKYASPKDGFYDHDLFLRKNSRYATAFKFSNDAYQFLVELKLAGYATDPKYVPIVGGVMKSIVAYISTTAKWPPSSNVVYNLDPSITNGDTADSGDTTGNTNSCSTSNGAVAGDIAQTAINLAWDDKGHTGTTDIVAKSEYVAARKEYNPDSGNDYSDCGAFVATVMRSSGADPDFPPINTREQLPYLKSSSKYDTFDNINNTDDLRPGDILIYNTPDRSKGHVYIYVGSPGGQFNARGASLGTHVPQASNAYFTDTDSGVHFIVARLK